jgi:predicted negative regulator of RcsB-dependent stress response
MDIYSTEEEQADAIKKWIKSNGPAIILGIALGLGGLKGWEYWQQKQLQNSAVASAEYEAQLLQIESTAIAELEAQFAAYKTRNENLTYNNFLQLKLAKRAVESGDFDVASTALNKVIAEPANAAVKHTATLRLARVLIANGKADDAIAMLNTDAESYKFLYAQVRGDAYLAKGEVEQARQAYLMAQNGAPTSNPNLQMKIDNLAILEKPLSTAPTEVTTESEAATDTTDQDNGEGGI